MEKKQSSIDWLIEKIQKQREDGNTDLRTTLFFCQQAKAMHKEEIMKAANNGCKGMCCIDSPKDGEQYYTKTFGGQDNE